MSHLILNHNFVFVDDDLPTVARLADRIPSYDDWRKNPITTADSTIEIKPTVRLVTPREDQNLGEFMDSIRRALFGYRYHAAALDPQYSPATVFLIDWKFDKFSWDHKLGPKPDGIGLCEEIRELVPHGFCCLVTAQDTMETTEADGRAFDFSISKSALESPAGESLLAKAISNHFARLLLSPTWDGLLDYSRRSSDTFHAMALGGSGNASATSRGFLEKFGSNLFAAEASLTLKPLDSLLAPATDGCISRSQDAFAEAFGARRARFATNGTTGANTILWMALFNSDDLVLVDRNCHISHHYSAARQGVTPIYLEPQIEVSPDIFGPPALETICERIETVCGSGLGNRLKGIVLTNCTFDGNLFDSKHYIETIDALLRSTIGADGADAFIYYFDEAWFSFGRFDPGLIKFTAMYAATHAHISGGGRPRVYAAQSVHKTLTAFRQASAILEWDEWPFDQTVTGIDRPRFKQSFLANTTTSPSAPIVASFDIARRQMCVDGARMIVDAVGGAEDFRSSLQRNSWASLSKILRQAPLDPKRIKNTFPKDPTKLTVFHTLPAHSGAAKRLLWDAAEIQINKFGVDSVMFMFMPGYERSRTRNVLQRLSTLAKRVGDGTQTPKPKLGSWKILLERCVNQVGEVCQYPIEVAQSGRIGMGYILFGAGGDDAKLMGEDEILAGSEYICCSFITPYPPGFPLVIPGQIISGSVLLKILGSQDEIHGVDSAKRILLKRYEPTG
jgi:arginine decarboxylase